MDLNKSYEFFKPECVKDRIHIIGCGSVGSTIAENLVRCGITKLTLWDFDTVESHNIVNQMFRESDVGKEKTQALFDLLTEINPAVKQDIQIKKKGWNGEVVSGYLFLCVDNIDLRRKIVEAHMDSPYVKAVFDVRTLLESAQHYAADWSSYEQRTYLLNTMSFSHDEAVAETPVSACGFTLGVATTVRIICAVAVNNFMKFVKNDTFSKLVMVDCFGFMMTRLDA